MRRQHKHLLAFLSAFLLLALPARALACPLIGGLVDYNCDGKHKIVFVGDSVVAGVGDAPKGRGGYVQRIASKLPLSTIASLGFPGISTGALLRKLIKGFNRGQKNSMSKAVAGADLVIIDLGRNDYWLATPPLETIRTLKKVVSTLRGQLTKQDGEAPPLADTTLLFTKRLYQRFFIRSVIDLMLASNSSSLPVVIRADLLGTRVIGADGIHPDKKGYDTIAKLMEKYISGRAQSMSSKARPDKDSDGVYDFFEHTRYRTDPANPDTDGDSYTDGQEIFTYLTNPLDAASMPTPTPTAVPTATP